MISFFINKIIYLIFLVSLIYSVENNNTKLIFVHGTGNMYWYDPFIRTKIEELEDTVWKNNNYGKNIQFRDFPMGLQNTIRCGGKCFIWPEGLSTRYRELAGKKLYEAIKDLKSTKPNENKFIKIIAHSHGGNVVAEAVRYAKKSNDDTFKIDEVVFLEVPIYTVTEEAINMQDKDKTYYIDKIYNVISGKDGVQVVDLFTGHFPLCRRIFDSKREIVNIWAKLSQGHNDLDAMENAYQEFKKKNIAIQNNLSLDAQNRFALKGGWRIWHDHGKWITPVIIFGGLAMLFFKSEKSNNIKKKIKEYVEKIKEFFDF